MSSSSSDVESDWSASSSGPDLSQYISCVTDEKSLEEEVISQIESDFGYALYLQNNEVEILELSQMTSAEVPANGPSDDRLSMVSSVDTLDSLHIGDLIDDDDDILDALDLNVVQRDQLLELMRNDSVIYSVPGLKTRQISRLQSPCLVNENIDDNCGICITEFVIGDRKRVLKCKHFFHADCIDQWLQKTALCPLCRTRVIPPKRPRLSKCTIL